MMQIKRGSVDC